MDTELAYAFGYFRLLPQRRCLLAGEQPIKLGARAFDLLVALVEAPDRILTKAELIEAVWPRLVVEENNLNVQIVSLRKLLGHAAIATIPGRGYRFTMPVIVEGALRTEPKPACARLEQLSAEESPARSTNLVGQAPTLYGRADDVAAVLSLLVSHSMVTIAGSAGIGKTGLGRAVAFQLRSGEADGVWWVELAPLTDPSQVATTVARALGVEPDGLRPAVNIVASVLRAHRTLLVLDNCEHLLDGVAEFVTAVMAAVPDLRVLMTSQEALKISQEHVFRLGTLAVPPAGASRAPPTPGEVVASGAGALFVARARAVDPRFHLSAMNVDAVVEICRCLDGIPLAIELAAARLPLLGVQGVRARLKERFKVLTGGTRAVLRRHQTLRAALEWSHGLLSEAEQVVFRRLGVFAGGFTLQSAQRVAEDEAVDMWDVLEHLGTLVDKSLVLAEGEAVPRYRMLETTRLFALEQLGAASETEAMLRRHAVATMALLEDLVSEHFRRGLTKEEDALVAAESENVRAAYDWAAGTAPADDALAVELGSVGLYALREAGGVTEAFDRTARLATRIGPGIRPDIASRFWLRLAALGSVVGSWEAYEAAGEAVELCRRLGDESGLYRALTYRIGIGARRGELASSGALVEEAKRIERTHWKPLWRTEFRWACYRWLQAEGRPEEALAWALDRAALHAEAGSPSNFHMTMGDNVADCELSAGRTDAAEQHCREALEKLGGSSWGRSHVEETLAFVCTAQGNDAEAIEHARAALAASRDPGLHFRLLEALALCAARQGRRQDAAWVVGYVDRLYGVRGEVRWPFAQRRRAELDELLAATIDAAERQRWHAEGTDGDLDTAFARAFGPASPPQMLSPALERLPIVVNNRRF